MSLSVCHTCPIQSGYSWWPVCLSLCMDRHTPPIYTVWIKRQTQTAHTHPPRSHQHSSVCVSDMTWGCAVRGKVVIRLLHQLQYRSRHWLHCMQSVLEREKHGREFLTLCSPRFILFFHLRLFLFHFDSIKRMFYVEGWQWSKQIIKLD